MVNIPEQAVQAATAVIRAHDNEAWGEDCGDEPYVDLVTRMLTAAAPHMSGSAREQALEEAVKIADEWWHNPSCEKPDIAIIRALKSQTAQTGWLPIKEEPDNTKGPFLVTNNPKALNAFDRPSHVWCVSGIYTDDDGSFCAFEGNQKIHGLTMFMPVVAPQTGGGDE